MGLTMNLGLLAIAGDPANGWAHAGHTFVWGPIMLLFWMGALIVLALFVSRGPWAHAARGPRSGSGNGTERAREILAERYARGEISTEEYWERRDQLS